MLPDKYRLTLPNLDDHNDSRARAENNRAIDRAFNTLPFGPNVSTFNNFTCVGATINAGTADYDFATVATTHTRFRKTHTKMRPESDIRITGYATCFVASAIDVNLYVLVDDTTGYLVGGLFFNEGSSHKTIPLLASIPSLLPGLHSYKLQWVVGAVDLSTNTGDRAAFSIEECYQEPV